MSALPFFIDENGRGWTIAAGQYEFALGTSAEAASAPTLTSAASSHVARAPSSLAKA